MFKKYKNRILDLEEKNKLLASKLDTAYSEIKKLNYIIENNKVSTKDEMMAALMRESLGMAIDFSAASTDKCLPPHFLKEMEEDERKNFVIDMETIYKNDNFKKVVFYMINLFATNAIYKYEEEQRKNGQIAVIAFRTLLKEFEEMHNEFIGYKQKDEGFDPLATMPE